MLRQKMWVESKKMWEIAAPVILTEVAQFSIGMITLAFVGHVGAMELAAASIVHVVLEGFVMGIMLGMGSALETLCGQAVGAGKFNMLGIYLQKSTILTLSTSLFLVPLYVFISPLLQLIRQSKNISKLSGPYTRWVIPQLFAHALNFPVKKYLQAQTKIWVMTIISIVALGFHGFFCWLLIKKLGHGLFGAAMARNITMWLMVGFHWVYVVSGSFQEAWSGFSTQAFKSLSGFVRLSLVSAIMLCLEFWYYTLLVLMVGWLKNPEIEVDALSICMNIQLWTMMITLGFNAAVSVRVSNELGARRPKNTKHSVIVAVVTSSFWGLFFAIAVLVTRRYYPSLFTTKSDVMEKASRLAYFLTFTILLNSVQAVLNGVAVGAGWQTSVALLSMFCYYIVGLPLGAVLGYKFKLGVEGLWSGMLVGALLQTIILSIYIFRANWDEEVIYEVS